MHDLEPYKSDHLFLLIGSNPLPNYVAATLLAHSQTTNLYLVHTTEVDTIARNLQRTLVWPNDRLQFVPVDDADANDIFGKVKAEAAGKSNIGLHYTGGTKAMAVHAYRAIESVDPQATFSYLNARTLKLLIDQAERQAKKYPVGLDVKLKIEKLLKLHNYSKLKKEITRTPFHLDLSEILLQLPDQAAWRGWCAEHLKRKKQSGKIDFRNKTQLRAEQLPPELLQFYPDCKTLEDLESKLSLRVDKLAEFLDGIWLEHYVLSAVQQISKVANITDCGLSIEPVNESRKFEFDVAAMRGYQLFALSCTTDADKSFIKLKLFEANIRARQMGGDEARVAMVCFASNSDAAILQDEVAKKWEAPKNKIRVFGAEHLPDLAQHLQTWFNTPNQ